ncbi:unnamed protein product [Urochloa humidicola]
MICYRRCQDPVVPDADETVTLFGWAAHLVGARRTEMLLHRQEQDDADAVDDMERVERFARVALWCIEPNPALRPTMHQVVHTMLETSGRIQVEVTTDPPGCCVESSPLVQQLNIQ